MSQLWKRCGRTLASVRHRNSSRETISQELATTLDRLEACVDSARKASPKERAQALDGLAFVAGCVMDDAAQEWERIVGRKWERYVD